jgi:hypothetical protein
MSKSKGIVKRSAGDVVHSTVKGALGAVPYVGPLAAELFQLVIAPPLEKRRSEWMEDIAKRLKELEKEKRISYEELESNDQFVDAILKTTQIALRNSQKEKLEALKNALVNVALGKYTDQDTMHTFLNFIDTFSVWHIRILKLYDDPTKWFEESRRAFPTYIGGLETIMEEAYPDLRGKRTFYDIVWRELSQNGLLTGVSLHTMMTGQGISQRHTTDLGQQFLSFIMTEQF